MNNKLKAVLLIAVMIFVVIIFLALNPADDICKDALEKCDNKNISIEGKLAGITAHQHFLPIAFDKYHIKYLNLENYGQITLLSNEEISCKDKIRIHGLLDIERIECSPDVIGKCPAEQYFVHVNDWKCLD